MVTIAHKKIQENKIKCVQIYNKQIFPIYFYIFVQLFACFSFYFIFVFLSHLKWVWEKKKKKK